MIERETLHTHSLCEMGQAYFQGSQYHTEGCTGLATGTIYFGYRSIPVYRFGFIAILYNNNNNNNNNNNSLSAYTSYVLQDLKEFVNVFKEQLNFYL